MAGPLPLPQAWIAAPAALGAALILGAAVIGARLPVLRQARLLEAAVELCRERIATADAAIGALDDGLAAWQDLRSREAAESGALLLPQDEAGQRAEIARRAVDGGFAVRSLRFAPPLGGEALDAVLAELTVEGERSELPQLVARIWEGPRVVRLLSLDVEVLRFGERPVRASLRWQYAAPPRVDPVPAGAPAGLPAVARAPSGAIHRANRPRWQILQDEANRLRSRLPRLAERTSVEARIAAGQARLDAIARWRAHREAEAVSLLRKVPALVHAVDTGALGRASLRPGPGGTLVISAE